MSAATGFSGVSQRVTPHRRCDQELCGGSLLQGALGYKGFFAATKQLQAQAYTHALIVQRSHAGAVLSCAGCAPTAVTAGCG